MNVGLQERAQPEGEKHRDSGFETPQCWKLAVGWRERRRQGGSLVLVLLKEPGSVQNGSISELSRIPKGGIKPFRTHLIGILVSGGASLKW